MAFDGEAFGNAVVEAVKQFLAPMQARIAELEKQLAERKSVAGVHIDREGALVATYSDGSEKVLGPVVGKDGEPGKPGVDGLSLESFDAELSEDGRNLVLHLDREDFKTSVELALPVMIYRGVWAQGAYRKGDTVTYQGSLFVAMNDTAAKPGTADWQLAAKRGRDGKGV